MPCNIDHTLEDVKSKLESQQAYLPEKLYSNCNQFLRTDPVQEELNELFHLLKKYDLASEEERQIRNEKIESLT